MFHPNETSGHCSPPAGTVERPSVESRIMIGPGRIISFVLPSEKWPPAGPSPNFLFCFCFPSVSNKQPDVCMGGFTPLGSDTGQNNRPEIVDGRCGPPSGCWPAKRERAIIYCKSVRCQFPLGLVETRASQTTDGGTSLEEEEKGNSIYETLTDVNGSTAEAPHEGGGLQTTFSLSSQCVG